VTSPRWGSEATPVLFCCLAAATGSARVELADSNGRIDLSGLDYWVNLANGIELA